MLHKNYPLANHTSWRIGGNAKYFYQPKTASDLRDFLKNWPEPEITVLGAGSNVLIRDNGIPHLVVQLWQNTSHTFFKGTKISAEINFYAEAAVSLASITKQLTDIGALAAANFAGIPGAVGGALRMNAGAYGSAIWDHVVSVKTINRHGKIQEKLAADFHWGYRKLHGLSTGNEWFLGANFRFSLGDIAMSKAKYIEILAERRAKQPLTEPNAGSVFQNPHKEHAAKLIESLGLKGYRIGDAEISEKHANFIVNKGNATAANVEALIDYIQNKVVMAYGIALIPEVHIIGI